MAVMVVVIQKVEGESKDPSMRLELRYLTLGESDTISTIP